MPAEKNYLGGIDSGITFWIMDPKPKQSRIGRWAEAGMGKRYQRGDLVQTMFDTGAFGLRVLYGEVIAAGPKVCRIRWESGITNRVPHDYGDVADANDFDAAREAMAALHERTAALSEPQT